MKMTFTILGQPPSKSNCYRVVRIGGHGSLAKSKELKAYETLFSIQIPPWCRGRLLAEPMRVELDCYFKTMANDLDNAAKGVLDCLQQGEVIKNDNKVMELMMRKFVDKKNPRAEITIIELEP